VIQYHLPESIPLLRAGHCEHPALARLRGRGPWSASDGPDGGVILTRGSAAEWTAWAPALGGELRYRTAVDMPAFSQAVKVRDIGQTARVQLSVGSLPVALVHFAPVEIGLGGAPVGPADEYGRIGARLWDRLKSEELSPADHDLVSFCRLALMSCTDLTEELCHAYRLITTKSVGDILDAASGVPKADAGGGG